MGSSLQQRTAEGCPYLSQTHRHDEYSCAAVSIARGLLWTRLQGWQSMRSKLIARANFWGHLQQMNCCPGQQDNIRIPLLVGLEAVMEKALAGCRTSQQVSCCLLNSSVFNCELETIISKLWAYWED